MADETDDKPKSLAELLEIDNSPEVQRAKEEDVFGDLTDFKFASETIRELILDGKVALDEMYTIAQTSQHPRAFEVYGQLLEKLISANKTLIDTRKVQSTIDGRNPRDEAPRADRIINNTLVVKSTAELAELLQKQNK